MVRGCRHGRSELRGCTADSVPARLVGLGRPCPSAREGTRQLDLGRDLGPEWQYVAPNGIVTRGDTTYIATADGIKVTWDDGRSWAVITDSMGAASTKDSVLGRIKNQYVLAIALAPGNDLWISDLRGIAHSPDGGRTWHEAFPLTPCLGGCANRARALR